MGEETTKHIEEREQMTSEEMLEELKKASDIIENKKETT